MKVRKSLYPPTWIEVRRLIRQRDAVYRCPLCNAYNSEKETSVHHIDQDRQNSDPMNLINLHVVCHNRISTKEWSTGMRGERLREYFLNVLRMRFNSSFQFRMFNRRVVYCTVDSKKSSLRKGL